LRYTLYLCTTNQYTEKTSNNKDKKGTKGKRGQPL